MKKAMRSGQKRFSSVDPAGQPPHSWITSSLQRMAEPRAKVTELVTITTMDAKTLVIAPFDLYRLSGRLARGYRNQFGLTPVADGDIIRSYSFAFEERRQNISNCPAKVEGGRIMIRHPPDAMKEANSLRRKQNSEMNKTRRETIQELTDEVVADPGLLEQRGGTHKFRVVVSRK